MRRLVLLLAVFAVVPLGGCLDYGPAPDPSLYGDLAHDAAVDGGFDVLPD